MKELSCWSAAWICDHSKPQYDRKLVNPWFCFQKINKDHGWNSFEVLQVPFLIDPFTKTLWFNWQRQLLAEPLALEKNTLLRQFRIMIIRFHIPFPRRDLKADRNWLLPPKREKPNNSICSPGKWFRIFDNHKIKCYFKKPVWLD